MNRKIVMSKGRKVECFMGGSGLPKVVILPGMSSSAYEWELVVNEWEEAAGFVIVHRPGCGQSEVGEEKRTTTQFIDELDELLQNIGVVEPFVLVGHSYGGLCAQHYAKAYPEKTKAVILVDSTSDSLERLNQIPVSSIEDTDEYWIRKCRQFATMNAKQLGAILDPVLSSAHQRLSDLAQGEIKTFLCSPFLYKAMASEIEHWEGCARRIKAMDSFPQVPLTVIGRDPIQSVLSSIQDDVPAEEAKMIETIWQELIQEQVGLSNQGTFILARHATHSIHLDRPDVIVEAMKPFLS